MTRNPVIRSWFTASEAIADNFAGGGGASLGIELALGRSPDVAINHDDEAIAMHAANHPSTRHYTESVWEVDPVAACGGKPVALAWFSPDCKHHSKAKGGKPRDQKIRGLAWVAVTWAARVQPRVIALENVEEFQDWGPLHQTGPNAGKPIVARKGQTFRAFVRRLELLGYVVEWRLLRACDYGAPTTRRRLFLVARRDGKPIRWPAPTHGATKLSGLQPYRTAAECIDWTITCPSIFDRSKPLAEKTLARIARGIRKFVLEAKRPFLLHLTHGSRGHNLDDPMPTITAANRGELALAVPYLVHRSNGERVGQAPRIYDVQMPLGTIVAQGQKHALCAAFLAKHYSDRPTGGWAGGSDIGKPMDTVTAQDHHSLVAAHLVRYNGDQPGRERVADLGDPLGTQDTSRRYGLVAAFLARYNGTSTGQRPDAPLSTVDTRDRFAVVTVTIDGEEYAIVDIGMRMLTPRELFRAQGFAESYRIDPPGPNGKPLSKTAQIRMCGNSVAPPVAAAVVRAQFQEKS